ncbi:unnamed protein product, partial [Callosobruchus maculatus]
MVFTERQKTELKTIAKEMVREMMQDKDFTEMLAGMLADNVFQNSGKDEMSIRLEEIEQSNKNTQLRILGIPESRDHSTETQIKKMFETKLGITDVTLQQCHRARKWKINEEELIVHVQSYPFLYDLTDARYSNTLIRENAWEEIDIANHAIIIMEQRQCVASISKLMYLSLVQAGVSYFNELLTIVEELRFTFYKSFDIVDELNRKLHCIKFRLEVSALAK